MKLFFLSVRGHISLSLSAPLYLKGIVNLHELPKVYSY